MLLISVVVILINVFSVFAQKGIGDSCTIQSTNGRGICKLIYECPSAIEELKNNRRPTACGFQGPIQIVCCSVPTVATTATPNTKPTVDLTNLRKCERKCVEYGKFVYEDYVVQPVSGPSIIKKLDKCAVKSIPLIVGGTAAQPREFPHMALLGYGKPKPQWLCGGTLISERYVLTAGHCLFSRELNSSVTVVRLGDLNIDTDTDEAAPIELDVKTIIPHPSYLTRSKYYDIALLELSSPVKFNIFIRPACLSTKRQISEQNAIASGWGRVEYGGSGSSQLLKVTLEIFSYAECNKSYEYNINRQLDKGIIETTQLCAGSHDEEKDTCGGDSGGPLQVFNKDVYCMYNIIGITSFGKGCGIVGAPAIYTRVSEYIDWIESVVWPQ